MSNGGGTRVKALCAPVFLPWKMETFLHEGSGEIHTLQAPGQAVHAIKGLVSAGEQPKQAGDCTQQAADSRQAAGRN